MIFSNSKLSIAPMMDWTDKHFRYFVRQFTKKTVLYSEMITAQAIVFGNPEKLLSFNPLEKPLILQLGGANPEFLAKACQIANDFDYDGINLNVGCPSERVKAGNFGASLRQNPELVKECFEAIKENSKSQTSIKTRIALCEMTPDSNGFDDLCNFVETVKSCSEYIIHARKARLTGFSPKQNRERLPINYDLVYDFKQKYSNYAISINGDITNFEEVKKHLQFVDGCMIGRAAYANPSLFQTADQTFFDSKTEICSKRQAVLQMEEYITTQLEQGIRLNMLVRPMLGLFKGDPGAAQWRRLLTEESIKPDTSFKIVAQALNNVVSSN